MQADEGVVGQAVVVGSGQRDSNYGVGISGYITVTEGASGIITRLGARKHLVRFNRDAGGNNLAEANRYYQQYPEFSIWVNVEILEDPDPNAPKPRKLGEVPEGGIAPNDPALKWLWEDAAKIAKSRGYCDTYDNICGMLGIPGRPRPHDILVSLGGINLSGRVEAHSKEEAEEKFRANMEKEGVVIPEKTKVTVTAR